MKAIDFYSMKGIKSFSKLEPNSLIEELVKYIEKELPSFPKSEEFKRNTKTKKNEDQHSLVFCLFMTNKCKAKFSFHRENSQKASSKVDIGVYVGSNIIFTIEAKVLPIPTGSGKSKREEHEYVYGKGAGIQRFKDGNHGLDNDNEYIRENGLLAYVKEFDFDYWQKKINFWIQQAGWDESEELDMVYLNEIAKAISFHN